MVLRFMVDYVLKLRAVSQLRICRPPTLSFDPVFMDEGDCTVNIYIFFFWRLCQISTFPSPILPIFPTQIWLPIGTEFTSLTRHNSYSETTCISDTRASCDVTHPRVQPCIKELYKDAFWQYHWKNMLLILYWFLQWRFYLHQTFPRLSRKVCGSVLGTT